MGAHALSPFLDLHYECLADLRKSALQTELELLGLAGSSTTTTLFTDIMRKGKEGVCCSKLAYFSLKLKVLGHWTSQVT